MPFAIRTVQSVKLDLLLAVQANEDVKILKNISKPSVTYKQAQVRVH